MQLLKYQRNTQYLKVINSKEDTCESKHVNTYRKKIQNVPITSCFFYERFFFETTWNCYKNICTKKLHNLRNWNDKP